MVYKDIIDSAPNTMEYKDFYQQLKQSNKNIGLIIGKSAVKKGIELNKFFMTTQLYLAGIMDTNTIEAPVKLKKSLEFRILMHPGNNANILNITLKFNINDKLLIKIILKTKGKNVFHSDVSSLCKHHEFEKVCKQFEKDSLGKFGSQKKVINGKNSRKTSQMFTKRDTTGFTDSQITIFENIIFKYGVKMAEYKKAYSDPDIDQVSGDDQHSKDNSNQKTNSMTSSDNNSDAPFSQFRDINNNEDYENYCAEQIAKTLTPNDWLNHNSLCNYF